MPAQPEAFFLPVDSGQGGQRFCLHHPGAGGTVLGLVLYIHQNPQKHEFVKDFREWPYSSYHRDRPDRDNATNFAAALARHAATDYGERDDDP